MSKVPIVRRGTPESKFCPFCYAPRVRRTHRINLFERSLGRLLSLHPYRCEACDGRYYIRGARRTPRAHVHESHSGSPQHI
jgi:hypothetical protein